jgi:hypothetical protein
VTGLVSGADVGQIPVAVQRPPRLKMSMAGCSNAKDLTSSMRPLSYSLLQPPPLLRRCFAIFQLIFVRVIPYAWSACHWMSAWALRLLSFIFKLTIFVSLLTFIQRQEPLLETTMDHSTKVLSVTNGSLSPIWIWMYVIRFDLNWHYDEHGHVGITNDEPIGVVYTRGFIVRGEVLWPWPARTRTVDLTTFGARLPFEKWGPNSSAEGNAVYCIAVEGQNVLSNQRTRNAILTTNLMFPSSPFGPMGNAVSGGGYQAVKKYLDLEETIKNTCMALYDKSH